ncbi:STAS domain-containing protein [Piscinibacter koreensis]|uniref:STAS domain-containing protein n=1 Tax=Piscinibacter koreensis TaxID=2742824 RepID=A0A7Y6TW11_9BURK|nr:STAS domain-containing protein [Schlegelella koreensis]NUZ05659.1 STAS domain-containing protein [Schlegelella koreensis]
MLLLPAALTASEATPALRLLGEALQREQAAEVTVDASALRHFDSSALAVLLECSRLAAAAGKPFNVRGAPAKLAALARLYGVDGLLWADAERAAPGTAES